MRGREFAGVVGRDTLPRYNFSTQIDVKSKKSLVSRKGFQTVYKSAEIHTTFKLGITICNKHP